MKSWYTRVGLGLSLALPTLVGCAEERAPIDRVQANALPKSFFLGEKINDPSDDPVFYSRAFTVGMTVVQENFTAGTSSGLDKIRWEVTEDMLIARKAYQTVKGRDNKGLEGPESVPNGTVVAAYKILGHFDIRDGYNPQTGEKTNVREENTTDRPWAERDYFRVDWATNVVADPMWDEKTWGQKWWGLKLSPQSYYISDPTHEDAPHLSEMDQGYFDITNKFFVEPTTTWTPWGELPTCLIYGYYTGTANYDCNTQEASIRFAFWKRPAELSDFEPLDNTYAPMDVIASFGSVGDSFSPGYGYPQQEYDPQYGYTDQGLHQLAGLHNIWAQSHIAGSFCESNKDGNNDGTADACAADITGYGGSLGSQCDVLTKQCTIPYRDRSVRTVGYWVNEDMPQEFQDILDEAGNPVQRGAAEDIAYSWNQMFMNAVAFAREAECRRTGDGDKAACHDAYFVSGDSPDAKVMVSYGGWLTDNPLDQTPVLVACHNPVRAYDKLDTCGKVGDKARLGDIRKNFMIHHAGDARAHYGGLGGLFSDPETNEYIGTTATTVYTEQRARRILDSLLVAMGDITVQDYIDGVPAEVVAKTLSMNPRKAGPKVLSDAEIEHNIRALNVANLQKANGKPILSGATPAAKMGSYIDQKKHSSPTPQLQAKNIMQVEAANAQWRGTQLEADLIDIDHATSHMGLPPGATLDDKVLDRVSPLRGMDVAKRHAIKQMMNERFANAGACYTENIEATGVASIVNVSLAKYFLEKYGDLPMAERHEAILKELVVESFKGVMLHEVGHSLGMRHQFASSWDTVNYQPQYWQLRTHDGSTAASKSCKGKARCAPGDTKCIENDTCLGPRYFDPPTADEMGEADESRPAIEYFAGTSTMEYQSERFSETAGLGTWDQHMTQAVYGRVLETYHPEIVPKKEQAKYASRMISQLIEGDLINDVWKVDDPSVSPFGETPFGTDPLVHGVHYTELARRIPLFDASRDCREATEEEKAQAKWRVVHGKVCQTMPRDHAAWSDFTSETNVDAYGEKMPSWHTRADLNGGAGDLVRWSYRYGESYGDSYVHTNMLDSGADVYEVTVNLEKAYIAEYPSTYFRKKNKRYGEGLSGIAAGVYEDRFERLRSFHWSNANEILRWLSFGQDYFDLFTKDDGWSRPALLANYQTFDILARSVLAPQPGDYVPLENNMGGATIYDASATPNGNAPFSIGLFDGRYVNPEYDRGGEAGGSYNWENYVKRASFSTEKAYAFLALTDSRPTLSTISRENYLDGRAPALNFRNDMPEAFDRLLGGLLASDWHAIGMSIDPNAGGNMREAKPALLDLTTTDFNPADGGDRTTPARPDGAMVMFPNLGFSQQLYAAYFTALYARVNTDITLVHKMRIWVDGMEGNIGDLAFPTAAEQIRFTDPVSGFTYVARRFGTEDIDGVKTDKGIASRMLQHANDLVIASYEVERDPKTKEPLLNEYGAPTVITENGTPKLVAGSSRAAELSKYRGLVDSVRQLGHWLGQGPL
jgi:hypothetical protein